MASNKNNKARCKKYFLVVEMTISMCEWKAPYNEVDDKTGKQSNLQRIVLYVKTLAPGGLQHYQEGRPASVPADKLACRPADRRQRWIPFRQASG